MKVSGFQNDHLETLKRAYNLASHADADTKFSFVLERHPYRRDMFGCIGNDGQQDDADERLWDVIPIRCLLYRGYN